MNRHVFVRREARADFDEAYDWYENRRMGLGNEFANSVQQTIDRIAQDPLRHGIVRANTRCALVPRFPYGVYYCVEEKRIVVIAVFHGSRNPSIWQSRVKE